MAPLSSPSPSMKLLLTDPKAKSKPESAAAARQNSDSSTSATAAAPPKKRTRDRPNLFNCHCCGRRINQDNPKDSLQTMDSIWRIVLLCRKCRKSIGSGRTCPYCFKETGDSEDLCQCSACERQIHEDCIRGYGNFRPWCYLGAGLEGFGVCVDCWFPELLKNSVRVCSSEKGRRLKNKAEAEQLGENIVKDTAEKVNLVGYSKEKTLKMTKMRNVMDLANGALDLLAKKDKDGNLSNAGSGNVGELATQLHPAINSSPTNLRSNCLENLSSLDVLDTGIWKGLTYERLGKRSSGQQLETCASDMGNRRMKQPLCNGLFNDSDGSYIGLLAYHQDRKRKQWLLSNENTAVYEASHEKVEFSSHLDDTRTRTVPKSRADVAEGSNDINADEIDLCTNADRFGQQYKRTRFRQKVCQVYGSTDMVEVSAGVNGICNDVGGLNLGLLCYKRDKKRKIWQSKDESTLVSEASLQTVMFNMPNLHLHDTGVRGLVKSTSDVSAGSTGVNVGQCDLCTIVDRFGQEYKRTRFRQKVCQVNGSIDISEGSANVDDLHNDANGVDPGLLTYKRDRKRKTWLLNYENCAVSEASRKKIKLNLQFDDGETRDPMKIGTDFSESSININTDQSAMCSNVDGFGQKFVGFKSTGFSRNGSQVNGSIDISEEGSGDVNRPLNDVNVLNMGLLPYTWDSKSNIERSNDENSVGAEASQQNDEFNLHLDIAKIEDPIKDSADISESSFDVNAHQSDLCTNVDRFGLVYKRIRLRQKDY